MIDRKYRGLLQGLLLLLIVVFAIYRFVLPGSNDGDDGVDCNWNERVSTDALVYVAHAKCRMACRDIDERLVEKVYLHGELNCQKSSVKDGKRRYALEKRDDRGDMIRIIVEDDDGRHVIITAIRLDKEDRCSCS